MFDWIKFSIFIITNELLMNIWLIDKWRKKIFGNQIHNLLSILNHPFKISSEKLNNSQKFKLYFSKGANKNFNALWNLYLYSNRNIFIILFNLIFYSLFPLILLKFLNYRKLNIKHFLEGIMKGEEKKANFQLLASIIILPQ